MVQQLEVLGYRAGGHGPNTESCFNLTGKCAPVASARPAAGCPALEALKILGVLKILEWVLHRKEQQSGWLQRYLVSIFVYFQADWVWDTGVFRYSASLGRTSREAPVTCCMARALSSMAGE